MIDIKHRAESGTQLSGTDSCCHPSFREAARGSRKTPLLCRSKEGAEEELAERATPDRRQRASKDNKVRSYSSSVLVFEFLFLSFPFVFALLLAKHTTEMIMAAPTRVPTSAPTMMPTSGSGRNKQLVGKVEHTVCLTRAHL